MPASGWNNFRVLPAWPCFILDNSWLWGPGPIPPCKARDVPSPPALPAGMQWRPCIPGQVGRCFPAAWLRCDYCRGQCVLKTAFRLFGQGVKLLVFTLLSRRLCTAHGSLAASGWVTDQPQGKSCLRNCGGVSLAGIYPHGHLYLCGPFPCEKQHLFLFPEELHLERARLSSNPPSTDSSRPITVTPRLGVMTKAAGTIYYRHFYLHPLSILILNYLP